MLVFLKSIVAATFGLSGFIGTSAQATTVLVDALPISGRTTFLAVNSFEQNFLMKFTVTKAVDLTGFAIMTSFGVAGVGDKTIFKLRNDLSGTPAASNLYDFSSKVTSVAKFGTDGSAVATISFGPIRLAAGTYWAGFSSLLEERLLAAITSTNNAPIPVSTYALNEDDMATQRYDGFKLYLPFEALGDVVPVRTVLEPATWSLMIGGFAMAGAGLRRRKIATARA